MNIRIIPVFLVFRVRVVASDRATRTAFCANESFEKYAYIFLATREIQTPNKDRTLRIAYTSSNGVCPYGVAHILTIVERSDCALCGLIGSKICAIRKNNVDSDGVHFFVELMIYERNPLLIS
jgi:hypothetical protein